MLSSVLNSKRAVQVNIQIMRTFTKIREIIMTHKDLQKKIEDMERKYNEMRIGGAELEEVTYTFWRDKLIKVMVTIKGNDNWKDLKDICFQKVGKGKKKWMSKECYWWFGETTFMALNYNESSEEGDLFLQSVVVARERNECEQWERKQEVKEGVEKGF